MNALADALARVLGTPVTHLRSVSGGDINDTFVARLGDGRDVFVKTNGGADTRMFPCEASGLAWLAEAGAVRVPIVLAVADDAPDAARFLVLEHIAAASRASDFDARLGRGLALLHRAGRDAFGFVESNFIATVEQDNRRCDTWAEFYATRRLEPLVRAAVDRSRGPAAWTRQFAALASRLPALAGPAEPPARLHGDLWSGNVIADERGHPVLVDPAVYGGHREMDLAMLQLFGSPGPAFFAAYDEVWPLEPGHQSRVALCQLYPLLVHVHLFGGHYVSAADAALRTYL